jgi:regulatory protein
MAGRITDIKVQRRNRKRVNIYLDGEYAFSVGLLAAASLGRGDVLSDGEIENLRRLDSAETAHDRTLNYLGYRPRSNAEVRHYLTGKGFSEQVVDEVIVRLSEAGLLDDLAFARYWVENRETFRPRGRILLRQELRQKGISDRLIDKVLTETDEGESAYAAGIERAKRYAQLDDEAFREKMSGFLRRRGFDYEVVRETVLRLLTLRADDEFASSDSSPSEESWKGV